MDLNNFIEFHSTHMIALLTKMGIYKTPKEAYHGLRDNLQSDEDLLKLKDKLSDMFNEPKWATGESGVHTISFDTVEAPSVKEFKQLKKDHKALVKRVEELEKDHIDAFQLRDSLLDMTDKIEESHDKLAYLTRYLQDTDVIDSED